VKFFEKLNKADILVHVAVAFRRVQADDRCTGSLSQYRTEFLPLTAALHLFPLFFFSNQFSFFREIHFSFKGVHGSRAYN
jgi:hypothetical protein